MADDRLIEVMSELLSEVHEMRIDMNNRFSNNEKLLMSHEKLLAKIQIELSEIRLSNMQIAEKFLELGQHETRINRLEDAVFRKAS